MIAALRMEIVCVRSFLIVLDIGFIARIDIDRVDTCQGYLSPTEIWDRTVV